MMDAAKKMDIGFRDLGVCKGDTVLMHSSYRSLGLPGEQKGIETVIKVLQSIIGAKGALLLPALSYETCHEGQRLFDVSQTPSCVGAISECFRSMPGVVRSVHPTHSVCGWGDGACQMLNGHHLDDTPCGVNSPYARLCEVGGKLLMLGCGLGPNTSMHGVEELARPSYLFSHQIEYRIRLGNRLGSCAIDDNRIPEAITCWRHGHTQSGYIQRYDRLDDLLDDCMCNRSKIMGAPSLLIDASMMWKLATETMRNKPYYFVDNLQIGNG
ncbi:SPBc2 prophage-derived aminoglycoside N(3')-acetyltransferase-like protein YokD [Poriferisphaera corsica]|uniref:Aminoglycoside N(3)-acetyltransferase n=1 Tax=Poriferisphaera corsica TaxID=2528020 RepID=A0A517YVH8_9BACT|nr:AAC(3) family N-acetyltransferase [Poriferisphaera corsica]QDU34182.1 SPBc2 prophage-derived aminoglycoside N(3')-acetyltransferase-like protein YokD [Poriferisphaera corsica]